MPAARLVVLHEVALQTALARVNRGRLIGKALERTAGFFRVSMGITSEAAIAGARHAAIARMLDIDWSQCRCRSVNPPVVDKDAGSRQ